eukprot:TRINITY_DN60016_c0_g1_i1.p1 TRINITY_DN60016_c0_g1~~TRINITY_DN60016_c0_g1_i1.p1  ORF type:complete len:381 (-),score=53.57 TRINITY_DN60016_c0_g1_i1:257-1399(-)
MGQTYSQVRWFLYGKKHFTRSGMRSACRDNHLYSSLSNQSLQQRVYVITGANSGLGKEVTRYLYAHGAHVVMVCRSQDRADAAVREITDSVNAALASPGLEEAKQKATSSASGRPPTPLSLGPLSSPKPGGSLSVVIADVGLRADVQSALQAISRLAGPSGVAGVLINAGALLHQRTLTNENLETTFAVHVLNGFVRFVQGLGEARLLGPESRVVVVTSGGAYLETADAFLSDPQCASGPYDGVKAYSRCKRAQIELVQHWGGAGVAPFSAGPAGPTLVTAHPGWADTPGVDEAIPAFKRRVGDEFRSTWEGAWGLAGLLVAPRATLMPGAMYLDGVPVPRVLPFYGAPSSSEAASPSAVFSAMMKAAGGSGAGVTQSAL